MDRKIMAFQPCKEVFFSPHSARTMYTPEADSQWSPRYDAYSRTHVSPAVFKRQPAVPDQGGSQCFEIFRPSLALQAAQLSKFCAVLLGQEPHRGQAEVAQLVVLVACPAPAPQHKQSKVRLIHAKPPAAVTVEHTNMADR